jgi:flagellar hook assembly protein FlgD
MMSQVVFEVPGNTDTAMVANDNVLNIIVPGVETNATFGSGTCAFVWDITNNQSQYVEPGKYYIKIEEADEFGHVNVIIKEILVVRIEKYIELKVYNSAGELVRTIREINKPVPNIADLSAVGDIIVIEKNGVPVNIKYGSNLTDYLQWDGKNEDGVVVSSGNYEIQLSVKTEQGNITYASKTVVLLREDKTYLAGLEIWPNPFTNESVSGSVVFRWTCVTAGETGDAYIRIYNIAGELVKQINTTLEAGLAAWDLRTGSYEHVGTGIYIAVITTKNEQGYTDIKVQKLAVVSYE